MQRQQRYRLQIGQGHLLILKVLGHCQMNRWICALEICLSLVNVPLLFQLTLQLLLNFVNRWPIHNAT